MALPQFIFGGDTGLTPEQVKRNRAVAEALLAGSARGRAPQNVGEGLNAIGQALLYRVQKGKADKGDALQAQKQSDVWKDLGGSTSFGATAMSAGAPVSSTVADAAPAAPTSVPSGERAAYIRSGLIQRGLPEHVADGFLANFQDESGLDPGVNEKAPLVPGSRGGFGLYQLTGPRRTAYESFAANKGVDPSDIDAQLDFMMGELGGSEKRAADRIMATTDAAGAAQAIVNDFLRPAAKHRAERAGRYAGLGGSPAPVQVASLDPSAGVAEAMDAKNTAVGQALGVKGSQPQGMTPTAAALNQRQQTAPAPQPASVQVAQASPPPQMPAYSGPDPQRLMGVLQNPWASDEQKQLAMYYLKQAQEAQQQAGTRAYDQWKTQQGYAREDQRFAIEDRREDTRLQMDQDKAAREAAKPIEVGGVLVAPVTMKPVYEAPLKPTGDMQEYDAYAADERAAGREPVGRLQYQQALRRAGSNSTTINTGTNTTKFQEKSDEAAAKRLDDVIQSGYAASEMLGNVQQLADLGRQIGTGKVAQVKTALAPYAEALGIDIANQGDAEAYRSIIARMAPQMRPAGSGASSDFDARQFLQGLPALGNTPEGNQIITDTFEALSKNKMEAAEIASLAYLPEDQGGITWQEAEKRIRALPNPYERFKASRKVRGEPQPQPDTTPREGGVPVGGQRSRPKTVINGYTIEAID